MGMPDAADTSREPAPFVHSPAPLVALSTFGMSAALWLGVAVYLYHQRCGDSCLGRGWTHTRSAWQWPVQFWCFAVPGFAAAAGMVTALTHRRPGQATASLASAAILFLLWYFFPVFTSGGRSVHSVDFTQTSHWFWLGAALFSAAGGAAAVVIEYRNRRSGTSGSG